MSCEMDRVLFDAIELEFGVKMADIRINVKEVKLKMGNEISLVSLE